jgi:uncharacterized protein YbdZ (MbtH family)
VFVVGDTGAGKTSFLFSSGRGHVLRGWTAFYVGGVDERDPPLGIQTCFSLREALTLGEDRDLWIGLDEVSLEISEHGVPSPELRMIAQFRRHYRVTLVCNSQRPYDLAPRIRDVDTSWRFMRVEDPSSSTLRFIRKNWPAQGEQVPGLSPYWYSPGGPDPVLGEHYVIGR